MKIYTFLLMSFVLISSYSCTDEDVFLESYTGNNDDGNSGTTNILKEYYLDLSTFGSAKLNFDSSGKQTSSNTVFNFNDPFTGSAIDIVENSSIARNSGGSINKITSVVSITILGVNSAETEVSTFTYNSSGQITNITCVETGEPTETLDLSYSGNVVNGVYKIGTTTIANVVYTFDSSGKLMSRTSTTTTGDVYSAVLTYSGTNLTKIDYSLNAVLDNSVLYEHDAKNNPLFTQLATDYKASLFNNIFSELDEDEYDGTGTITLENDDVSGAETASQNNVIKKTEDGEIDVITLNYNTANYPINGVYSGATILYTYY